MACRSLPHVDWVAVEAQASDLEHRSLFLVDDEHSLAEPARDLVADLLPIRHATKLHAIVRNVARSDVQHRQENVSAWDGAALDRRGNPQEVTQAFRFRDVDLLHLF